MAGAADPRFRIATDADLSAIADLRWRLKAEHGEVGDEAERDAFTASFVRTEHDEVNAGELVHWLAERDGRIAAIMSVRIVDKVPKPGKLCARWGYLTNVYALPDARDEGLGSALLAHVKGWAEAAGLELLVVWPGKRSLPFYERAGFAPPDDLLVLEFPGNE